MAGSNLPKRFGLTGLLLVAMLSALASRSAEPDQTLPGEFRIHNGKVDSGTYAGWALFHSACHGCHGTDALGTDLAPNLVERAKSMTPRSFATRVLASYRLFDRTESVRANQTDLPQDDPIEMILRRKREHGSIIEMPVWKDNRQVEPHVLDLFAYLSARAAGKLGPGEPMTIK